MSGRDTVSRNAIHQPGPKGHYCDQFPDEAWTALDKTLKWVGLSYCSFSFESSGTCFPGFLIFSSHHSSSMGHFLLITGSQLLRPIGFVQASFPFSWPVI